MALFLSNQIYHILCFCFTLQSIYFKGLILYGYLIRFAFLDILSILLNIPKVIADVFYFIIKFVFCFIDYFQKVNCFDYFFVMNSY